MFNNDKKIRIIPLFVLSLAIKIAVVAVLAGPLRAEAASTPPSFADLAEDLLPTVVNISTTQKIEQQPKMRQLPRLRHNFPVFPEGSPFEDFFNDFFNQQFPMQPQQAIPATSLGSGFILNKDEGLIITNNHVIKDADEIKVTLHNDTILPATIVGTDEKTDIAVLKADLNGQNVGQVRLGDSDIMRVGDWVLAIGNPFGLGGTVTAGIISARQRDINSGPYDDYIQTDASINRGNSGGPMFNINGEVIGINTAIFSPSGGSVGIGFAIPSALAKPIIKQLVEFGHTRRGWLGVRIQSVTDDIAESLGLAKAAGALVADVTKTGPAEKAGIKAGDIILVFDNKPVPEMRHLPRIVAETDIGTSVPVIVWRDGKRVTVSVTVGELEKAEENGLLADNGTTNLDATPEPDGKSVDDLGLTAAPLSDVLRETYGINSDINGLVITGINVNSDAAKKGISEGDVITDINQTRINTISDLEREIEKTRKAGRDAVLLLINSQNSIQFVAVKLQEKTDAE